MDELKLYDGEFKFATIVWENEPLASGELVNLSAEKLGWKKSTVYTVLKKLCERNILKNQDSVVTAIVKKDDVQKYESEAILEKVFDGSLPKFIASFLDEKRLSEKEVREIQEILNKSRKG
ncbi:MAG: BlaI/MecI/CopY family transcriptional regulator [Oscillospiraceae bacterium]|jgi:predicted transcriptional regulator|nr:BlaI/MecI/CopY family transcriptional regulator [Oscillospiraceae bacterium]